MEKLLEAKCIDGRSGIASEEHSRSRTIHISMKLFPKYVFKKKKQRPNGV